MSDGINEEAVAAGEIIPVELSDEEKAAIQAAAEAVAGAEAEAARLAAEAEAVRLAEEEAIRVAEEARRALVAQQTPTAVKLLRYRWRIEARDPAVDHVLAAMEPEAYQAACAIFEQEVRELAAQVSSVPGSPSGQSMPRTTPIPERLPAPKAKPKGRGR